ncbi:MAG: CHAD domain-containing protein [Spirochaetaceae bacterium]
MTELLDDPLYTLDPCAETAQWCAGGISALRSRLRNAGRPYRVVIDHTRKMHATLVDTFDWRVLESGRIALLLESDGNAGPQEAPPLRLLPHAYRRREGTGIDPAVAAAAHVPVDTIRTSEIRSCIGPRALLRMGDGELSFRRARLINANGKTEAIVDEVSIDGTREIGGPDHLKRFLLLRPLRGYGRVLSISLGTPVGVDGMVDALAATGGRRPFDFDTRLNLPIRGDDDAESAHRHVVTRLVGTMAAVRPWIGFAGDPEFLHDYRVALRRLRSYLKESGLGPPTRGQHASQAVDSINGVWEATGAARDFDVFMERRAYYLQATPVPLRNEVEQLFDRIAGLREKSYETLFARLPVGYETDLEAELLSRGPAWGRGPSDDPDAKRADTDSIRLDVQATRWVRRREKKFLKLATRLQNAYSAAGKELDDETIHAARKAAKKYRYLHEIFLPVLNDRKHTSKRVKRLRKLQNLLGSYNDLVVEEARFHEILTGIDGVSYGDVRAATAYLLARVERQKAAARRRMLKELSREVQ